MPVKYGQAHDYVFSLNRIKCRGAGIRDINLTIVVAFLRENHKSKRRPKTLREYARERVKCLTTEL